MFSLECRESPSRNEHRSASASSVPMVVFPDPETPIITMIMAESCSSSRTAPFRSPDSCGLSSKDKTFHCQCEALFLIGTSHKPGLMLHLLTGVPHSDAHPAALEHEHIVRHISNSRDICAGDMQHFGEDIDYLSLVGFRMSYVQVIGLGTCRRHALAAFLLHVLFAARHRFKVITDSNDLRHSIQQTRKARHHGWGKLDSPFFTVHVRTMTRRNIPILIAINPDIELLFGQDVDHGLYRLAGKQVFANDRKIGIEEQTAVKRGDWVLKLKSVDQHLHASWRPAA